ncbi:hypothetical protein TNCV_4242321 [Trichonephila clavipes]|nr:hypothetical protein TNCV_4242321 [Trichonephila clavipes]
MYLELWHLLILKKRKTSEIGPLSKEKLTPNSGIIDSPIRYRSKYKCFGTHNSSGTGGYLTAQQVSHSWASADQMSFPITPEVG